MLVIYADRVAIFTTEQRAIMGQNVDEQRKKRGRPHSGAAKSRSTVAADHRSNRIAAGYQYVGIWLPKAMALKLKAIAKNEKLDLGKIAARLINLPSEEDSK